MRTQSLPAKFRRMKKIMRKPDKSSGIPESHNVICAVMLAAFFFALLIGMGVIESNSAAAATGTDAGETEIRVASDDTVTVYVDGVGTRSNEKIVGAIVGFFSKERVIDNETGEYTEAFQYFLDYGRYANPYSFYADYYVVTTGGDDLNLGSAEIDAGTYYVVLVSVPEGYIITSETDTGRSIGVSGYKTVIGDPLEISITDIMTIMFNVQEIGYISLTKTDAETGEALSGAVFSVYSAYELPYELVIEDLVGTMTTDEDGMASMEVYLNEGSGLYYYITETEAPEGYVLSDEAIRAQVQKAGEAAEVSVTNRKPAGIITLTKADSETGEALSGAVFAVYDDETDRGEEHLVGSMTTGTDGTASITLPIGTYYVVEAEAPDGYAIASTDTWEVEITEDGQTISLGVIANCKLYTFSLIKEYEGDVPSDYENTEFEFQLTLAGQDQAFSSQPYTLWELGGDGQWRQKSGSYSTDSEGYLYLYAGQKAVFENVPLTECTEIEVAETESVYWECTVSYERNDEDDNPEITCSAKNSFRVPLIINKITYATPKYIDEEDYTFEITVTIYNEYTGKWEPYADSLYWIVKSSSGTILSRITKISEGISGADGTISIHSGESVAIFFDSDNVTYQIEETYASDDYINRDGIISGTTEMGGSCDFIVNFWRWKDLILTKRLMHQDTAECSQEFTFQILHVLSDGSTETVSGNTWKMTDDNGNVVMSGELNDDGEFTAACAGYTVTVSGLEAGESYQIIETESGENYTSLSGTVSVTAPYYSTSVSAFYANDWIKRSLSVTKYVAGDEEGASEGVKFTFTLLVEGTPASDIAYTIKESGTSGTTVYYTDENGQFQLEDGQTAVFEEAGSIGETYEVIEMEDASFPQIWPENKASCSGVLADDENAVTFVNGTSGSLMISKSYAADSGDVAAEEYVLATKGEERESASITFSMTVDGQAWPTADVEVELLDTLSGTKINGTWTPEGITVTPWTAIIIPETEFAGATNYTVSESTEDKHRVLEWTDGAWIQIDQYAPEDDAAWSGTFAANPVAEIVNHVASVELNGSAVYKHMTAGSDEVSTGAELVWILQCYDGESWIPAEGVAYLTFDEEGVTCPSVLYTDESGTISLEKSNSGYPYIVFLEANVGINVYSGMEAGDYRITEDSSSSDEEWGLLAGYGTSEDPYAYSISTTDGNAFANSNRMAALKVEKVAENGEFASFTFLLKQVLSTDEDGNILGTIAGSNLSYAVYNAGTGEKASDGSTDAEGKFTISSGQYALFDLPDGTIWTITEAYAAGWEIVALDGEAGEANQLSDATMEVHVLADTAYIMTAETTYQEVDAGMELSPDEFAVTVYDSRGGSRTLSSEEFELSSYAAQDTAGEMEITVAYGDLRASVTIYVTGTANVNYLIQSTYTEDNELTVTADFGDAFDASMLGTDELIVGIYSIGIFDEDMFLHIGANFGEVDVCAEDYVTANEDGSSSYDYDGLAEFLYQFVAGFDDVEDIYIETTGHAVSIPIESLESCYVYMEVATSQDGSFVQCCLFYYTSEFGTSIVLPLTENGYGFAEMMTAEYIQGIIDALPSEYEYILMAEAGKYSAYVKSCFVWILCYEYEVLDSEEQSKIDFTQLEEFMEFCEYY